MKTADQIQKLLTLLILKHAHIKTQTMQLQAMEIGNHWCIIDKQQHNLVRLTEWYYKNEDLAWTELLNLESIYND